MPISDSNLETRLFHLNPMGGSAADTANQTNAASTVTYAAQVGAAHVVYDLTWSYVGGTVSGGNIQITDGSAVIFNMDIAAAGQGQVLFQRPRRGVPGNAMTITLAAGGASVVGKLNVGHSIQIGFTSSMDFTLGNTQFVPLMMWWWGF